MNRRTLVTSVAALLTLPINKVNAAELCDPNILNLIASSGLPTVETAKVFGCQPNQAAGLEYGLIRSTQTDVLYEAIGSEALSLIQSIDRMSTARRFDISLRYDRTKSEIITLGPYSRPSYKYIGDENIMFHDSWMNNIRELYFDDFEAYALANRNQESSLWSYIEWFVKRRDITLEVLSASMNPMAAAAFRDGHNYGFLPWPWHLTHAGSIERYLDEQEFT